MTGGIPNGIRVLRCRLGWHDQSKYVRFIGPRQIRANGRPYLYAGHFVCPRCGK